MSEARTWAGKPWTRREDELLTQFVMENGECLWRGVSSSTGLQRSGRDCRDRWLNYLRPNVNRGPFTPDEEALIVHLHSVHGDMWWKIALQMPTRTENDIKFHWETHLSKVAAQGGDPGAHELPPPPAAGTSHSAAAAAAAGQGTPPVAPPLPVRAAQLGDPEKTMASIDDELDYDLTAVAHLTDDEWITTGSEPVCPTCYRFGGRVDVSMAVGLTGK